MWTARNGLRTGLALAIGLAASTSIVSAQRPADMREEAKQLARGGQVREALEVLDTLLKRKPRDIESRMLRGELLLRLNRPEAAIADFDAAGRIDPLHPVPWNGRGIALLMLDRPEDASIQFKRSLALNTLILNKHRQGRAIAHDGLGQVKFRTGDFVEAIAEYDRAIAIDPTDPNGYVGRGDALVSLGRLDDAVASYGEALRIDPNHARGRGGRGDALMLLGRNDEALADLDLAVELEPTYAKAHSLRGSILAQRGENERALADFDAVIRLVPTRAAAYKDRGGVLVNLGR